MEQVTDVLTRIEAAAFLRVPPATLAYWAIRRRGPRFSRLGRRVVYQRRHLQEFLDGSLAGGAPPVDPCGR